MEKYQQIVAMLKGIADPQIAANSQRFFKTNPGEYGYGDVFLGIRVPVLRKIVKTCHELSLAQLSCLLGSSYHEARLLALFIMVGQYAKGDDATKTQIYRCYLANTARVNNWDLVDSSAHYIVGPWLAAQDSTDNSRLILTTLAHSTNLWERRIAIMATFHFIRQGEFTDTLALSTLLLNDSEDLIHKAVGWMLREVGNRDRDVEEAYLLLHYQKMPRMMLRYAIEKFSPARRQQYLKGQIG